MDTKDDLKKGLVSIIMPSFNSENYIKESVMSIKNQIYSNWELIIIDDKSTDQTLDIIRSIKDDRINVICLEKNSGAAHARNEGVKLAKGEYLAFLDSDDLWVKDKLKTQVKFMEENGYHFTCTEYAKMNESSQINNIVKVSDSLNYEGLLKHCPGNSTIMYNAKVLGKFYAPLIKRRNDFAMWLQVIKKAKYVYGLHEPYTIYRVRDNSLSSNKLKLLKYQWKVFREIEKLSIHKSMYLLIHKIYTVTFKVRTSKIPR